LYRDRESKMSQFRDDVATNMQSGGVRHGVAVQRALNQTMKAEMAKQRPGPAEDFTPGILKPDQFLGCKVVNGFQWLQGSRSHPWGSVLAKTPSVAGKAIAGSAYQYGSGQVAPAVMPMPGQHWVGGPGSTWQGRPGMSQGSSIIQT